MVKRLHGYNNLPLINLNINSINVATLPDVMWVAMHGYLRSSIAKSS